MATNRGRTGTVRGMSATRVREFMVEAVLVIGEGNEFTRANLRELYCELGVEPDKADAMVHALMRVAGVATHVKTGVYRMNMGAGDLVRHRGWKLSTGRLGVAGARRLVAALDHARSEETLPHDLEELYQRGRKALRNLR